MQKAIRLFFGLRAVLLFLVAGAGHRTALAASAAADSRLALLFLLDDADEDRRDDRDQHRADKNRPDMTCDPLEHTLNSLFKMILADARSMMQSLSQLR